MTSPREYQRRVDRDLLAAAATKIRRELARERGQSPEDEAPIVPYGQGAFAALLDKLSVCTGRGQTSDGVRQVAVELAGKILDEGKVVHRVIWAGFRP